MNKSIVAFLMSSCLLSACANFGIKEQTQAYGGKFQGNHSALSRCVVDKLQSDSRWLIRGLQYETWAYPDVEATEVYGYSLNDVPGIFARTSPTNPDSVGTYPGMPAGIPIPKMHVYRKTTGTPPHINPNYLFILSLKRTDPETVFATLNGKRYESNIVWEKLKACASGS